MKIKVKVCTEKHIVEARTIVLDTEEYPRLQEMIDNGELKDISNGGEYPEGGRFWRLDWTDTTAKELMTALFGRTTLTSTHSLLATFQL
jgi:hypothetical protein